MKLITIIVFVMLIFCNGACAYDSWNVTWTPVHESIIDKEYIITVQNLEPVKRSVNISSFFDETSFDISKLHDVEFFELELITYTDCINHFDQIEKQEYINGKWETYMDSIYAYTEYTESEKLGWSECKSKLFKTNGKFKENNYGFINIPKFGSDNDGDGTYNGTKVFKLKFTTPPVKTGIGYGSVGKVAILLDGVEYHPYWDISWGERQEIILTGGASGAQINYQTLLNVTYNNKMQSNFDDIRFTNDTHEMDSWLESKVDSSYALIWVEFFTTPADGVNQTYYMYYNNSGVSNVWNITNTFLFGDNFTGSSLNTSKWTGATGSTSVANGIMTLTGTGTWLYLYGSNHNAGMACRYKAQMGNSITNNYDSMIGLQQLGSNNHAKAFSNPFDVGFGRWSSNAGTASYINAAFPIPPQYAYYIGGICINTTTILYYTNDTIDGIESTQVPQNLNALIGVRTGDIYVDWITVRNYVTYPSTYLFGNVEIPPPKTVNISLHSQYPSQLFTNYTGFIAASYIVESNYFLNYSSLAFLMGMNYTLTQDYHAWLKVPANDISDSGIYRAHNRNTSPYMNWESNDTITESNVWKWAGGTIADMWIVSNTINETYTWVNITGVASNIYPSMFYLDRNAMYESEKTGIAIDRAQGVIIKVWSVDQLRDRNYDFWVNLYMDTQIESTPNANIDIWYCNGSFNPATDDPEACVYCERMDTWTPDRWIDHEVWQPHSNVSYAKPLIAYGGIPATILPDEIDYIYFTSETVTAKSYILNATNVDPGICNTTFAQTKTMWLRNKLIGTNTPHAYTPSFYMVSVRDYLEFTHHLYIANNQDVYGHSDYNAIPIGISNAVPTFCKYNYFWIDNTTDYLMTGTYTDNFWVNLTYGLDPDNGALLTHVLSLYDDNYNFVKFINSSLVGTSTSEDILIDISGVTDGQYMLKIISTDNEGSTSVAYSPTFTILIQHELILKMTLFYNTMVEGLEDFKENIGKFIVWGVLFAIVTGVFALIAYIDKMIGGK